MQCSFKIIGAVSIVALTLGAVAESFAETIEQSVTRTICLKGLNREQTDWDRSTSFYFNVEMAIKRGLTVDACRKLIAQPDKSARTNSSCTGILAGPVIQKLAATALTQTKQEVNTSSNAIWGAGRVFESFQQNLERLINLNVPPPSYGPPGPGPQIIDYGLAAMLTANREMTSDQFISCFPQGWEFAKATQQAKKEFEMRQEKARQEAEIEAAKPVNRLRQAYFDYMVVKRCYDVRLGYQLVYINEVELERAKRAVNTIEASALKEDSSIDTGNAWQEGIRMIETSQRYVEQYFCQKTFNDLLSAAPYSPPVKDFGRY